MSPARSPRRARSSRMARSRRPTGDAGSHDPSRRSTSCDQDPQDHPKRGGARLGPGPPAPATGLQDEVSQAPRLKLVRLLAEASEQRANGARVVGERAFRGAAVLAHPLTEGPQQRRSLPRALDHGAPDDARPVQVSQEDAGTMEHLQTARMAVAWASAAPPA